MEVQDQPPAWSDVLAVFAAKAAGTGDGVDVAARMLSATAEALTPSTPTAPPSPGMRRYPATWCFTRRIPMWASWGAGTRMASYGSYTVPADTTMW